MIPQNETVVYKCEINYLGITFLNKIPEAAF
jgi:hypothetical protein